MKYLKTSFLAMAIVAALASKTTVKADDKPVLRLRTFAVDLGGATGRAGASTIDIVIERWSTDAERARLSDALVEKGSDKLLSALQDIKPRAGFIRGGGNIGWDIQYARQEVSEATGSRRIVIATDRPIGYWEATTRPRSADFEFTLAEIRLSRDGKGEGKLVPAAKVSFNKDTQTIEIENYGTEPVRLNRITEEKN